MEPITLAFSVANVQEYIDRRDHAAAVTRVYMQAEPGAPLDSTRPDGSLDLLIVDPSVGVTFHAGQVYRLTLERVE